MSVLKDFTHKIVGLIVSLELNDKMTTVGINVPHFVVLKE
jgi:hypothetical protein